jgi:hypothetical protein
VERFAIAEAADRSRGDLWRKASREFQFCRELGGHVGSRGRLIDAGNRRCDCVGIGVSYHQGETVRGGD